MEEDFNPMLEPSDTLAEALAEERDTLLEVALAQDEKASKPQGAPRRKRLSRETAREALTRMEDAARTEGDFDEVIEM